MHLTRTVSLLLVLTSSAIVAESNFERDRAAILAMTGEFKVNFDFEETVALTPDYELTKPYQSEAKELVLVADDQGKEITLQHLLVVSDMDGPQVIKHWAQIWKYEDLHTLDYQGEMTWQPVISTQAEAAGTWTQYVTQVDDSPRYKARGQWIHENNYSAWTSQISTRPLPRREYTKRSDYDLLKVVNQHVITPGGWVHLQQNRKIINRDGTARSLCLEIGKNAYQRVTAPDEIDKEDFAAAQNYWNETDVFWGKVRGVWDNVLSQGNGPIHYKSSIKVETKENKEKKLSLMGRISSLAESYRTDSSISSEKIEEILAEHLR